MILEVHTAVKILMWVFWVVTSCGLQVDTSVLDEHTVCIFRAEKLKLGTVYSSRTNKSTWYYNLENQCRYI
jgi:hypothetical protein